MYVYFNCWYREHEGDVAKVLLAVSRLLAKPASHDFVELCELRNMLLIGNIPQPLKFIDPKQFANNQYAGNHFSNETFYGDFGTPCVAYVGNKTLTFWPDEWQRALGGIKAVGHYVQWYHEEQPGKGPGHELAGWLVGRVVSFTRETAEHTIQLEPTSSAGNNPPEGDKSNAETAQAETGVSKEPAQVFRSVNLSKVKHLWIDSVFRNRIASQPIPPTSAQVPVGDSLLEFANTDVGQFIRLWWTRYSKYFYGRVVRYDPVSKTHTVCYEDGDTRAYDMLTKDYTIIVPPHEVLDADSEANLSDAQASKIVADWHRALESTQTNAAEAIAKEMQLHQGEAVPYKFTFIHRPMSVNALTVSIYQLAVVDEYFKEGGADALFQSLTDASQAPPVSRIILLHLQLIFLLRNFLGTEKFTELAWDLKEAVPFALLRYEDAQIKDLNPKTLNDLLNGLQDVMLHLVSSSGTGSGANSGHQYTSTSAVRDAIDELRLAVAGMLLVCSQLQKRYLGLSMIKDTLDVLLPPLDNYVTKRYAAIGLSRSMRAPPSRPGPAPPKSQRITKDYFDRWLVENNILEILFGESLHQDLVAKSDILLLYMGSRKVLTEKHLDLIWNASLGVHEAVVRVLHQLLVLIVPVLGPTLRNYLFSLMAALPCKDYTEQILQLIKAFTEQALIASKEDSNSSAPASSGTLAGASTSAESSNNNNNNNNNKNDLDSVDVAPPARLAATVGASVARQDRHGSEDSEFDNYDKLRVGTAPVYTDRNKFTQPRVVGFGSNSAWSNGEDTAEDSTVAPAPEPVVAHHSSEGHLLPTTTNPNNSSSNTVLTTKQQRLLQAQQSYMKRSAAAGAAKPSNITVTSGPSGTGTGSNNSSTNNLLPVGLKAKPGTEDLSGSGPVTLKPITAGGFSNRAAPSNHTSDVMKNLAAGKIRIHPVKAQTNGTSATMDSRADEMV